MYTNPSTSPLYQPCLPSLQYHNSPSHFLIYLFYFVNLLRLTRAIFEIRYQLEPEIQLKTWDVQIKTAVIFFHRHCQLSANFWRDSSSSWKIFILIWEYLRIFVMNSCCFGKYFSWFIDLIMRYFILLEKSID